ATFDIVNQCTFT
nr:RecName: Full=Thaumatin-like protein 1a; AltName: Full=Acidic thaumatin-like protein; AltName: Full=Beta-1,3-glucanase [Manilkara zapota]